MSTFEALPSQNGEQVFNPNGGLLDHLHRMMSVPPSAGRVLRAFTVRVKRGVPNEFYDSMFRQAKRRGFAGHVPAFFDGYDVVCFHNEAKA